MSLFNKFRKEQPPQDQKPEKGDQLKQELAAKVDLDKRLKLQENFGELKAELVQYLGKHPGLDTESESFILEHIQTAEAIAKNGVPPGDYDSYKSILETAKFALTE